MEQLATSNLTLGIHNRDAGIFNNSLSAKSYTMLKNRIVPFNDKQIKLALDKREFQYAILLRKSDSQYVSSKPANMHEGKPYFYTIPDCPLPCFIVYGLRYGSPFLQRLNYIIYHLFQAGILQYWSKTEEYSMDRNRLGAIQNKERKPLNITNLQELFYVLAIGEFISIVVFILEILFHKFKRNNIE